MASAPTPPRLTLAMDLDRVESLSADLERIAESNPAAGPLLRELVAHCKARVPHYDWVGVYLRSGNELQLGPYAGATPTPARLAWGEGVPGAAAQSARTVMADAPGGEQPHGSSRSELAVPIGQDGVLLGVFAVASAQPSALNEHDQALLERAASFMAGALERASHPPRWLQPEIVSRGQ